MTFRIPPKATELAHMAVVVDPVCPAPALASTSGYWWGGAVPHSVELRGRGRRGGESSRSGGGADGHA